MGEESGIPKWASFLLTGLVGSGVGVGGISGLDLMGADAKAHEREAFLNHIQQCEKNRTISTTISLQIIEDNKNDCQADKTALRALIASQCSQNP